MASIIIMRGTWPRYITIIKLAIMTTVDPARILSDLYLLFCTAQRTDYSYMYNVYVCKESDACNRN